jgi:alpha-tubulin suppressor-like RCC1 family protein
MIYSFGKNSRGQLGFLGTQDIDTPTTIPGLEGVSVSYIETGRLHSAAIVSGYSLFNARLLITRYILGELMILVN